MQVRILGPVEVEGPTGTLTVDSPKERAVLEVLALRAGDVVSPALLVDALWGPTPPRSAPKSLQSHISRLRHLLPDGLIETRDRGYRLGGTPHDVDLHRFERLAAAGRQALDGGDHRRALGLLDEALELWRGAPLIDLADGSLREGETARLDELRWAAREGRVDAALALGRHEDLVAELEAIVADAPLRERPWGQLIIALYRSGRRAEALEAYQRIRRLLREELGIEPGDELQALETQVLFDDPALDPPAAEPPLVLPTHLTSFVGREPQLVDLAKLLDGHRLVTLLGPGGVGKSRLAVEVAVRERSRWRHGAWWVDVAHSDSVDAVLSRLLRVLDVVVPPGMIGPDALRRFLAVRQLLIVVDNAEGVADDLGEPLVALLEAAPEVTLLVTSRIPLDVAGEQRYTLAPLELPELDSRDGPRSEAVRVFLDRLDERGVPEPGPADLPDVAALCRSVDGLPLGLELMATMVGPRAPSEVLDELGDAAVSVGRARPAPDDRHASLEAVLEATVTRLQPDELRLLVRLSVFLGSFDAAAARAVGDGVPPLAFNRLIDLALVSPAGTTGAQGRRYRLLETTRAYAAGRSQADEASDARRRHAWHYRELVVEAGAAMDGPEESQWLDRLRGDDLEIRAALGWYADHDPAGAPAFARAVGQAVYVWGELDAARQLLDELVAIVDGLPEDPPAEDLGWIHLRRAWPRFLTGDLAGGEQDAEVAVDWFRAADVPAGAVLALSARAHLILLATADTDAALGWYHQAIAEARRSGEHHAGAWAMAQAAQALVLADRVDDEVDAMMDEAEAVFRRTDEHFGLAHVFMDRALAAYARDDLAAVERAAEVGIIEARSAGEHNPFEQVHVLVRGVSELHRGAADAFSSISESARMAHEANNLLQLGLALQALAVQAAVAGRPVRAARLWGAAQQLTPIWPLFGRRYGELLEPVSAELGARFDDEVAIGAALPIDEAVALGLAGEGSDTETPA